MKNLKKTLILDAFFPNFSSLGLSRASILIPLLLITHLIKKQLRNHPEIARFRIYDNLSTNKSLAKSNKKLKMFQDSAVSTNMISNECMIHHRKVHMVSQKNIKITNFNLVLFFSRKLVTTKSFFFQKV